MKPNTRKDILTEICIVSMVVSWSYIIIGLSGIVYMMYELVIKQMY